MTLDDHIAALVKAEVARQPCCPHPVERHAYNGCANCGCCVTWLEHPDRERDNTESANEARDARWRATWRNE